MANDAGHGGYRQPSHPAAVSGPGAHSARTDRGPKQERITGGSYGSSQAFTEQQQAAPMSAPQGAPGGQPAPAQMPTGLGDPSQNPEEPVTAGANAGLGPSAVEAGIERPGPDEELRSKFGPLMPVLRRMADSTYATDAFKAQVRALEARIT